MKLSIIATVSAVLGTAAAANQAIVINDCSDPIYVQSYPYDGGKPGTLTAVKPGERFSEDLLSAGSTVKIDTTKTLKKPLFFGYSSTSNPDYLYYEFSNEYGNPFAKEHNILSPGAGCDKFDCEAGDDSCYSTPDHKRVYGCPKPVNVYARICAS